jgi:predicted nucleic acid-binding Zn ribbon protein
VSDKPQKRMTRGQWTVYRERCRIAPGPQPPKADDHAIGDALPGVMKQFGLDAHHWVDTLTEEWGKIVGAAVGGHTRPGRLDGSQLTVFVDSSVWLNELKRYGAKQMLGNLQSRFGASRIRNIRLQLDPDQRGSRR